MTHCLVLIIAPVTVHVRKMGRVLAMLNSVDSIAASQLVPPTVLYEVFVSMMPALVLLNAIVSLLTLEITVVYAITHIAIITANVMIL